MKLRKIKRAFLWFRVAFTRHELWALTLAQRLPLLAMLPFLTLWIWFIVPAILILFYSFISFELALLLVASGPDMLLVVLPFMVPIAYPFVAYFVPWAFRWHFIYLGLMRGRTKMAQAKERELNERLVVLT